MNFQDYQEAASRTAGHELSDISSLHQALANYAMGLAGETGELVDGLKKELFHGRTMSREHFEEEAGDVLWYLANLCAVRGVSLERVAANNIAKLQKRYPDGFKPGGGVR